MKKLNVCILDRGSRGGLAGLIYHYSKLGHNVFYPFPGTSDLHWEMSPLWPVLLQRSSENPDVTNFDYHKFGTDNKDRLIYGEDQFLLLEEVLSPITPKEITCKLVDFENDDINIDIFHTTDHVLTSRDIYKKFTDRRFPNATWVSSTFDHFYPNAGQGCDHICRFLPALHDTLYHDRNNINFYRHQVEFDVLGVTPGEVSNERSGYASFNHNFHVRHPREYAIFCEMNEYLKSYGIQAVNYGGNIRRQGADLRYAGDNGKTGNYQTLSPRKAAETFKNLNAVIHFKGHDWAGGVEAYARFARTPMIVLGDYVKATHAQDLIVHGRNAIHVSNGKEAAEAVLAIENNIDLRKTLSQGMDDISRNVHSENYWSAWRNFISNIG